jgi:integrase
MSRGEPFYKRCKCKGADKKELGPECPKLKRADGSWNPKHGTWYFALELPPGPGGKRRPRMRRGGFESREAAIEARDKAKATMRKGVDPSVRVTTGDYLARWLAGRRDLKPTTRHNYENSISTYLIPLLGHVDLAALQPEHIADAFATIREWNAELAAGRPVRKSQRHVGPAAMQRIRNVLQAALRDAIKARMIEFNAAKLVSMDPATQHKPTIWTKERVRKFWADYGEALERSPLTRGDRAFLVWRSMALRPSPVMVWNLTDVGAFLDYASGHRMMPVFELAAGTGLRRGELCGLRWTDVDLDAGTISVTPGGVRVQAGWEIVEGGPKTEGSGREVSLVAQDVATLKAWKRKQSAERLEWGQDWAGGSLVFTREDGTPWHPDAVTDTFERLAFAAHLPPVRLHDMRHAHISELFAAGVDARIISERVGHMGSKMTRDYAAVAAEVSRAAAEKVVGMIPRSARQ